MAEKNLVLFDVGSLQVAILKQNIVDSRNYNYA